MKSFAICAVCAVLVCVVGLCVPFSANAGVCTDSSVVIPVVQATAEGTSKSLEAYQISSARPRPVVSRDSLGPPSADQSKEFRLATGLAEPIPKEVLLQRPGIFRWPVLDSLQCVPADTAHTQGSVIQGGQLLPPVYSAQADRLWRTGVYNKPTPLATGWRNDGADFPKPSALSTSTLEQFMGWVRSVTLPMPWNTYPEGEAYRNAHMIHPWAEPDTARAVR